MTTQEQQTAQDAAARAATRAAGAAAFFATRQDQDSFNYFADACQTFADAVTAARAA